MYITPLGHLTYHTSLINNFSSDRGPWKLGFCMVVRCGLLSPKATRFSSIKTYQRQKDYGSYVQCLQPLIQLRFSGFQVEVFLCAPILTFLKNSSKNCCYAGLKYNACHDVRV